MEPRFEVPVSLDPDPVIEAYKAGIDVTLLRENLRLTVDGRVRKMCEFVRFLDEVRGTARDDRQVRETAPRAR